jgi:UV DNA damage repair endonuclease
MTLTMQECYSVNLENVHRTIVWNMAIGILFYSKLIDIIHGGNQQFELIRRSIRL